MPLRLDIKRKLVQRTDRVKGVDLHPTEPWLLSNLYSGNVYIWNYNELALVKSFEVTELPVRSAKFIARKQWMVCGADDMFIRIYNYNTMDKVKAFEAHTDYIRCIAVHPTLPCILSSSDDMLIKLWDWDKNWQNIQVFEGHSHYVMQVVFNPKDTNTFASASLDRTVKVWSLGQPTPNFTLEGHEKGVNCVDYFNGGDRPYLITGADDKLVKVWDYQTKACVQTLQGHTHNVAAVCFHPELPIIVTGSEDGMVKIWHSTTYRLENTLNYGMERVWALGYLKGSNGVAIGYDEGVILLKVGREEPVASMDGSGKVIWAKHNEIQTVNLKSLGSDYQISDGERLPLAVKDLGSCDMYPQSLQHNPNGRFVVVCGDGEYIVYTALAWRNKSFGSALELVWGQDSSDFAVRQSATKVVIYKNFQEKRSLKLDYNAEGIFGGAFIGVRTADFICFYDWNEGKIVRRIDVPVRSVHWSDNGELVCIVSEQSFFILKCNRDVVDAYLDGNEEAGEDGVDDAFELLHEISEKVRTGLWVGDCFIYCNAAWRLNYVVGGEITTLYHLDRPMFLLGYLAAQSRIYLIDKEYGIVSYTLLLAMLEFKTCIIRGDVLAGMEILKTFPKDQLNAAARFLEANGLVEEALSVATDPDHRFDLAVQLGDLNIAQEIAVQLDSESKWKQLGEMALRGGKLQVASHCLDKAKDLSGLLLMYTATGDARGLESLIQACVDNGKLNIAFAAYFLLGRIDSCVQLLLDCGRFPEAGFFARTYAPSKITDAIQLWKEDLMKQNPKAAESLADPAEYPNLFPDLELALKAEVFSRKQVNEVVSADSYPEFIESAGDLLEKVRELSLSDDLDEEMPEENGPIPHAAPVVDAPPVASSVPPPPTTSAVSPPAGLVPPPTAPPAGLVPPPAAPLSGILPPPPASSNLHPTMPPPPRNTAPPPPLDGSEQFDDAGEDLELDDDWGLDGEEEP